MTITCNDEYYNGYYESRLLTRTISDQNLQQDIISGSSVKFLFPSTFIGNLVLNSTFELIMDSTSYSLTNIFRYEIGSVDGMYVDTLEYYYVYGDYISEHCVITYTICAENCYSCSTSDWCTSCFSDTTYYLENNRDRCYYPIEHYYIYNNIQLEE